MINFLPLQQINASFEPELSAAVQRVVRSGWYLRGEETRGFEEEFARYIGVQHVVGVGNGLDALTLALQAAAQMQAWEPGSEVIVPAMTFVATAEAVLRAGFVPRFADVDDRALLTPETAEAVVSERTRAIVPVHLYGHPAPMKDLMAWAAERSLFVLEDAAQAHGARIDGRNVGSWGHAAAFSFYPGKNLGALGDGGAVATADGELAECVRLLANYGAREKYVHEVAGVNSRLDELQAAALRVKLRRLDADGVSSLLGNALCSVIPSEWYENNPLGVIESLCAGTPVVGARNGGIPELINQKSGIIFTPKDVNDLKDAITQAFSHDWDHSAIKADALRLFSPEQHLKQLSEIYNS